MKDAATTKQEQARQSLPEDLRSFYDAMVADYRFAALQRHGSPFVSYMVIADLIRAGWRPSGDHVVEHG